MNGGKENEEEKNGCFFYFLLLVLLLCLCLLFPRSPFLVPLSSPSLIPF